ncbi:MAG TPA: hypothetical protein GXX29_06310 [Firmicutes bacterium]|nr:hypothetical protein [Bacillota bacterium]
MTSKELVHAALDHQRIPRAPYAVDFTVLARAKARERLGEIVPPEGWMGDIVVSPVIKVEWGKRHPDGFYVDEFGVEYDRRIDIDIGIPKPIITRETLTDFIWPDPEAPDRFDVLADNLVKHPDKFQIMALDFSLYERAWSLRGLSSLLEDMVSDPDFVEALLDCILAFNLAVIDVGLSRFPEVDAVYFGDDYGTQTGVIMGAPLWRKYFKPRLAQQYAKVKKHGKKVFIHSCGAVSELFPDLIEIGVDCFNPFQPEVMDICAVKRFYSGRLSFWGGVSTQRLLPFGTIDEVQAEITRLIAMARDGGYIVAPAHAVPADADIENVAMMVKMLVDQVTAQ